MLKIAVFDTTKQGKQLIDHLLLYSYQKNTELEVSALSTCAELREASEERLYDLIFLNIDGDGKDIQQIGNCLRGEMRNEDSLLHQELSQFSAE